MLEIVLLIGLIALVIVLISTSKRKRELTEVQKRLTQEEYKQKRKLAAHKQSPQERYDALGKIKELLDQGVQTNEEFRKEKKNILSGSLTYSTTALTSDSGVAVNPLSDLDESKIIGELAKKGYRSRQNGIGNWRITEPFGGDKICTSFEEYSNGIISRVVA